MCFQLLQSYNLHPTEPLHGKVYTGLSRQQEIHPELFNNLTALLSIADFNDLAARHEGVRGLSFSNMTPSIVESGLTDGLSNCCRATTRT